MAHKLSDQPLRLLVVKFYVLSVIFWVIKFFICVNKEQTNLISNSSRPISLFLNLDLFFLILDEECLEVDANKSSNSSGILCFNEAIPILQFICCKLDETQRYCNSLPCLRIIYIAVILCSFRQLACLRFCCSKCRQFLLILEIFKKTVFVFFLDTIQMLLRTQFTPTLAMKILKLNVFSLVSVQIF